MHPHRQLFRPFQVPNDRSNNRDQATPDKGLAEVVHFGQVRLSFAAFHVRNRLNLALYQNGLPTAPVLGDCQKCLRGSEV